MNQDNTKSVEIDVLALLHKLWTKKLFDSISQLFISLSFSLLRYLFLYPTNIYINNAYLCG